MNLPEFTTRMTDEIQRWSVSSGSESRAFLKWFLVNYFRIDEDIAPDYICDKKGDKGIDGIYADDLSSEVFIFQCKYSPTPGSDQGDSDLKTFDGVKAWFQTPQNVQSLDNSLANQELKGLIDRLELIDKVSQGYAINLIFLTNKSFDQNASEYLKVVGDYYNAWDINKLFDAYTYAEKDKPVYGKFSFGLEDSGLICHDLPGGVTVLVFTAKANDIVRLAGIQEGSLFDKNVRYGLGKTAINRQIAKTVQSTSDHDMFVLFNNGITMICESFELGEGNLDIENYAVVNGCQTVLTLYENRGHLSDSVRVLVRVTKTGTDEALIKRITYYNNNQNAINPRDLKSNDKAQEDIQKQFFDYFDGKILYNIKRGESQQGYDVVIPNDFAAQLIASFVLKESYTAHQKTKLFTDNYQRIFSRHISPLLICLLWQMYGIINENCAVIDNPGARDYRTTRFFFMFLLREIFEEDPIGSELIRETVEFYKTYADKYRAAFDKLSRMLVLGFNNYVAVQQEDGKFFDYKNVLRNAQLTKDMAREIITDYKRALIFNPEGTVSNLLTS